MNGSAVIAPPYRHSSESWNPYEAGAAGTCGASLAPRCRRVFGRRLRLDRQRVDPLAHQAVERRIDRALALEPAHPLERRRDDLDAEVALAAAVVAGMAAMLCAVV